MVWKCRVMTPECFTMPGELRLIVLCHVDDLLIAGNEVDILIFKNYMQTNFEKITFEGNKNEIQYIGMIFKRYQDKIEVSQPGYLNEIIRRFKLKPEENTASSPATENITQEWEEGEKIDVSEFRSKVMTIMFITRTWPDVKFPTMYLSARMKDPKMSHGSKLTRIAQYLNGTQALRLTF